MPLKTYLLTEERYARLKLAEETDATRPKIVCLCGSTRFSQAFQDANLNETLAGHIVLSIGCNMRSDTDVFGHLSPTELEEVKRNLDALHFRKIELADEILVLNVGGYVGLSTSNEIRHARALGKPVRWLEEPAASLAEQPGAGKVIKAKREMTDE